ncbi:MAG: hypothetical protein N3A63_00025 [Bacteroidetes bacterium]|nr:hypothetical protein [Bacteroidota bacterium]
MKSSFILNECVRVLAPGFFFSSFLFLYLKIFFIGNQPVFFSEVSQIMFFFFSLCISGVLLYILESPKRRKAFLKNQPSHYIKMLSQTSSAINPLTDEEATKLYFYILNTLIPERFHEKIIFFGSVYFVIIQLRRIALWFGAIAAFTLLIQHLFYGIYFPPVQKTLFMLLTWWIYYLTVRYNKAERKIQEIYDDQIIWLQMNSNTISRLLYQFKQIKGSSHEQA